MKHEEKPPIQTDLTDPKPPRIQSTRMESRREFQIKN